MMRELQRWVIVLLLAASVSTPWGLLQSVAWFGMVVNYSQQVGFSRAISMTLDGKHPCRLCHLVQEGQSKERQTGRDSFAPEKQLDWNSPPRATLALYPPPVPRCSLEISTLPQARSERPPIPPPRFA